MQTLIIKIEEASDEGYMYDFYTSEEALEECDSIDGGQCTSPGIDHALMMAYNHAQEFIQRQ